MADHNLASSNGANSNGVFPELVIDIEPSSTRQGAAPPLSPIGQTVTNALREVLAWRPNADAKGFVAALNQAFSIKDVKGHTEFEWTPRSYAVQADMGAVTGAQASIYARAKAALDQSVPLLEGLFTLSPDADHEDTEASRAVVTGKLTDLVYELGVVGGPRIQRVDDYFNSLLGNDETPSDPETVGGLFRQMREEFGFKRQLINTIDEEQNFTNYLIVVDNVISLQRSWVNVKKFFGHQPEDVFLGTELVKLSRKLAVVAESVQELYFVLDSVFLGAAEREIVVLGSNLTIAELFSWVERFCTEEAPRLIREGGKDGVISFRETVNSLAELVEKAVEESNNDSSNPQQGFHHPRTQAALEELSEHLDDVRDSTNLLRREPPLIVEGFSPTSVDRAKSVAVTLIGDNFQDGATVYLDGLNSAAKPPQVEAKIVHVLNANQILAVFDLDPVTTPDWAIVVRQNRETASLAGFSVRVKSTPPPPPPPKQFAVKAITLCNMDGKPIDGGYYTVDQDGKLKEINAQVGAEVGQIHVDFTDDIDGTTVELGSTVSVTELVQEGGGGAVRFVAYGYEVQGSKLILKVGTPVLQVVQWLRLGEGTYVLLITGIKSHNGVDLAQWLSTKILITPERNV